MPAVAVFRKGEWVVLNHRGGKKILGRHTRRSEAQAQARAVNASLREKGKIP